MDKLQSSIIVGTNEPVNIPKDYPDNTLTMTKRIVFNTSSWVVMFKLQ